ncbi:MAG TPA: dihydropyrimidinase [Candidatus Hungatella pullicola]|nr:dihydropyrimidinase [Candidatus Hungatella pullicola]
MVIKNGRIVSGGMTFLGDVLIEGETIKAVGKNIPEEGRCVIDAVGKYVIPGAVDVHTHMDLQAGQCRAVDDFYHGTVAAACGGTTTIVDHMAFGPAGCSLWHQVKEYHRLADGKAVVDYGFHGVIQHVNQEILREMGEIFRDEGITSFKIYLTYDNKLSDLEVFQVLERAKELGAVIPVHCENDGVVNYLREKFKKEKKEMASFHPLSRPSRCEAEAVGRMLHLAAMAGNAPVYIVHLSSMEGLKEIEKAACEGRKNIGVETCTQYLTLTDQCYQDPKEGLKFIMSPPLRSQEDCQALWKGIERGLIDVIATDHCPFCYSGDKQLGAEDFTKCPNGAPGVEERLSVIFSQGVAEGKITIEKMVDLLCTMPSKMYGLYPQKGVIQPGADGDIVILDPEKERILTKSQLHSAADYTCYEGMKVRGDIDKVIQRGRIIVDNHQFLGKRGDGKYIKRGKSILAD